MTYTTLQPANSGGGTKRQPPGGRIGKDGQLTVNHAAADLISNTTAIRIHTDNNAPRLLISPTGPQDKARWALSGGGNTQHRAKIWSIIQHRPDMVGAYNAELRAAGLVFTLKNQDETTLPPNPVWTAALPPPGTQNNRSTTMAIPAQLQPAGYLVLSGRPVEQLGSPNYIKIEVDTAARRFILYATTEADPLAWRLSGTGTVQRRVKLTTFIKQFPSMAGEYSPGTSAHGLQLVRKRD